MGLTGLHMVDWRDRTRCAADQRAVEARHVDRGRTGGLRRQATGSLPRPLLRQPRAIGTVWQALVDGDIEEIDAGPMKGAVAFSDLSDAAWLDGLLLYRFRYPGCGQNFVLGAETYHGSGSSWGKSEPLGSNLIDVAPSVLIQGCFLEVGSSRGDLIEAEWRVLKG